MASTNGIELPVSLQLKNLNEIANQIKQFANKNVLADSFGGKKLDSELNKILTRLEQISAKSKTAFTTQSDFTSVQKEINQVELSLNKVQDTIKNLGFSDLKIPAEFSGQIAALQGRIRELNGSLATFKGTQKEKLVNNVDFMANLQAADPKQAAKWLEKSYDELQAAINDGMSRVNMTLSLKAAEFADKQKLITQNSKGKTSMTQWGALSFIEDAFKTLPNDDKQRNTAQQWISEFMKTAEDGKEFSGFAKGAQGMNKFLASLKQQFSFSDEQMAEMRARIKQQVQELRAAGEKEATAATVVKSMGKNEGLAKQILFGSNANDIELAAKKYANDIKDAQRIVEEKTALEGRAEAFGKVKLAFDVPNEEIKQKADEIAEALKVPEAALKGFEESILSAATKSPELAALFQKATGEIATLTNTVEQGKQKLQSIDNAINKMQGISNFINRYVGLYAIVRKVTTAIRNAFNNIKELDKAITGIAVVTNMSQQDLWGKIGEYTQMAQQYGVATKDVYEVSQIFYQQGLQTSQVMSMTTESLKMAKIAGIDYTTAANAMTVAVRAFKLEMTEAQAVTDTYSALAAKFAVSSSEIANAMEKTASSAASVGMSLQSTSAFISVMEQTTRESAQNIGSALKSIISRYGEMKASPEKLLNVEGEEVAFNKVDTALASIGISIKDVSGQFRDFDDVIMELASKWNALDNNTQRYIATIMAGNRQQSRFIALVSNYDELSRAMNVANNAENASIVQVAKTMDSLESKANQVKNAFSQLYLDLHIEEGLKGAYDWLTRILKTIGKLGTAFGTLPTLANIIGFGTGAKALVGSGMDWLKGQKGKWEVKTEEAQQRIEQVRAKASEDIITKWQIQADLSQLEVAQTQIQNKASMASTNFSNTMLSANPNLVTKGINDQEIIATATKLYQEGRLKTADDRAYFMKGYDINPDSEQGRSIDALLQSFTTLQGQADSLGTTLEQVKNAGDQAQTGLEQTGTSGQKTSNDLNNLSNSTNNANIAENNEISASAEVASAKLTEAQENLHNARIAMNLADAKVREMTATDEATRDKLLSAQAAAHSDYDKALAALKVVEGAEQEKGARSRNTGELDRNTGALRGNTAGRGTEDLDIKQGISWKNNDWGNKNAMKIAGVASSLARMAGTAIVAAGAQYQDKSTDKVETSKLLTGVGNGLSMAGTGASMGMAFGPWGAAVGAIGGFLVGGLGAIIDGATMTLEEQLALEKEEAKEAADESLKAQAKATDLSNQIDNIKQLQKVMYNSTEDMQAYKDAMNTLASQYPALVSVYDEAGNAIIEIQDAEQYLASVRQEGSRLAREAAVAEAKTRKTQIEILDDFDNEMETMINGGKNMRSSSNQFKSSSAFVLKDSNGQLVAITGNESVDYGYGYGDTTHATVADEFIKGLEILKKANPEYIEDEAVRERVQYYKEHENETISVDDFKLIGNYIADKTSEPYGSIGSQFLVTGGGYTSINNKQAFKDFINSDIEGNEYDFSDASQFISKIDKFLTENGEALGISAKTAKEYFTDWDWENGVDLTQVQEGWRKLQSLSESYNKQAKILNEQATRAYAQEEMDIAVNSKEHNLSTTRGKTLSTSGIFTTLLVNGLEAAADELEFDDAASWADSDKSAFIEKKKELSQAIINWTSTLTDGQLNAFINASDSMDTYRSVEEILENKQFNLDSADESVQAEIIQQFTKANEANRNRILKTVYNEDDEFNTKALGNLGKLTLDDKEAGLTAGSEYAESIANLFKDDELHEPQIISKYADYFTSQLLAINDLAEEGYTELASTRLSVLDEFSTTLVDMTSKQQQDMFGIITSIDFSSYDSIQTAMKNMKAYAKKNDIADIETDKTFGPLYEALTDAANNLLFNVNTLAQELTSIISSAVKDMDSLVATNKSGLSFDKALEEFANLQAQFSDITKFDQIFTYDAALQKYVYTTDGLQNAINAKQQKLAETSQQLSATADIYTKEITGKSAGTFITRKTFGGLDTVEGAFTDQNSLISAMRDQNIIDANMSPQVSAAYEALAADYIAATKVTERSAEDFKLYVQQRAQEAQDAADAALLIEQEYQNNIKNQYYQAIDWSKLALGTDFTGTNQMLANQLAEEVGLLEVTRDESGKIIASRWHSALGDVQASWDEILDTYLEQTYDSDEARKIAKTAINGQIQQQKSQSITTAISEVLQGGGAAISEGTAALLKETGKFDSLVDESGLLRATGDYVQSAIDLFNATKDSFTTVSERNKAYLETIEASFSKANATKTLMSSGNRLDFNTLESAFTSLGLYLDNYYNAENNLWTVEGELNGILETDAFGSTEIKDWDKYIKWIAEKRGKTVEEIKKSPEYEKYYSSYIDALISDEDAKDLKKSVASTLSTLSSAKVGTRVNVSALSEEIQKKLDGNADGIYHVVSEAVRDQAILALEAVGTSEDAIMIRELQRNIKAKNAKGTMLNNITSKTITSEAMNKYLDNIVFTNFEINKYWDDEDIQRAASNRGFIWDEYTQSYRATSKALTEIRSQIEEAKKPGSKATAESIAELETLANQLEIDLAKDPAEEALRALLANYTNAESQIATFKTYFKDKVNIDDYTYTDKEGNTRVKVEELKEALGADYAKYFDTIIAQIADAYIENASKAGTLITEGTTSKVEMQAFQEAYSQLMDGQTIEFFYDSVLQAWTFDSNLLRGYLEAAAKKTGLNEADQQSWIEEQIKALTVDNLDFSAYLAGTSTTKDQAILKRNLENYFKTHQPSGASFLSEKELNAWVEQSAEDTLNVLSQGGQVAIDMLTKIKPEATQEEIEAAYRVQIAPIKALYDQIDELQVGSIVAKNQIDVLTKAGFQVNKDGVVTAIGDLVQAYKSLYNQMQATGKATTAELNAALGKYLDNRNGEQQVIDALSNATSMTYSQLAEIYTAAGKKLTLEMVNELQSSGIIKSLGGNKMMIQDFKAFAAKMNWSADSEEYISAYKAYNDSLISYDRQVEKSIVEELQNLTEAKPGDKINLTDLASKLTDGLDTVIEWTGAKLEDGILTITDGVNLPTVIQDLTTLAAENAALLPEELAELADTVNALLDNMVSLISNGISGGLKANEARELSNWAKQYNLNLNFDRTKNGLKLSVDSAEKLYEKLKDVDSISAQIILDDLNESIEKSVTSAKELEGTFREIAELRATTESDDFKFMSHEIPSGQNNPINYLQNWSDAFAKIKATTKGGAGKNKMDYSDFYNIITEMGNLANQTGAIQVSAGKVLRNSEDAASLIEQAALCLSVAADGSVKVDLSKLGINFASGADTLKSNVNDGIKKIAQSQIEMLDGMIQLMETIVAMEELGNIDTDNKGTIDLGEIFDITGIEDAENHLDQITAFTKEFDDARKRIYEKLSSSEDGKLALEKLQVRIGQDMVSAAQLLDPKNTFDTLFKGLEGEAKISAIKGYQGIFDALYKAYLSGNYNLNDIIPSIKEILAGTGYTGDIQLGDTTLHFTDGLSYEIDSKGHYIYNGKDYGTDENAIKAAIKTDQLKIYSNIVGAYDEANQQFTNTAVDKEGNTIEIVSRYNIDTNKFEATFSDGTVVTSNTTTGLSQAIQHYVAMADLTLNEVNDNGAQAETNTLQYSITKKGEATVNWEVSLETGEVKYLNVQATSPENANYAGAQAQWQINKTQTINYTANTSAYETGVKTAKEEAEKPVEGTVNYRTGEIEELTDEQKTEEGIVNWTNNFTYPEIHDQYKTIWWQNVDSNNPDLAAAGSKGTIGLAQAKGTLMGELGPELVVQGGRYFVAGQNGAEMVNLEPDAIVFNHLQTKSLLEKGMSNGRGRAVTNERNAVAFATGNINGGPAMASASAALAALIELRNQWKSLLGLNAKDLSNLGGSGGGGGGGKNDPKAFIKDLEKWYNWLQRIAVLEQKITYEEQKRSKIQSDMFAHGQDYTKSQLESLDYLKEQAAINQSLVNSQQAYFDKRREQMNSANNPFSALYTFDEYGQLKYKDGALEKLSKLSGRNNLTGEANYSAKEQYEMLTQMGYGKYMDYDSSGNPIDKTQDDWYVSAVEAFWNKIDSDQQEMQSLHDSIEEHKQAVLEAQEQANEIMHDIEDNQISVEDKVLKAVEDIYQQEIDNAQDTRDAIEKANNALLDGLDKQLAAEKQMYDNQKDQEDLTRLQRQLAILQRSGGSASQIASLQSQINDKQQDIYFDQQQEQIDALREASENELQRLDAQIDLMTETLEYAKANGLLWEEVYDVMAKSPEEITSFITTHDRDYWGESPTAMTKDTREILFEAGRFKAFSEMVQGGLESLIKQFTDEAVAKAAEEEENKQKDQASSTTTTNTESPKPVSTPAPVSSGGNTTTPSTSAPSGPISTSYKSYNQNLHYKITYSGNTQISKVSESHSFNGKGVCSKCGYQKSAIGTGGHTSTTGESAAARIAFHHLVAYDRGGMVEKDGTAYVHAKEGVLTPEQTSILRNEILSNKPTSLLSLLTDFRDAYNSIPGASAYNSINNSGVVIENATVEMNVSKIANDYDAQRAGEQALDKIMSIARKTQGQNRIGR